MALKPRILTVTVTTAGTRVRVVTDAQSPNRYVPWAYFEADAANTGAVYIGDVTVASSVYSAVLDATGSTASLNWALPQYPQDADSSRLDLYETYVDAANNGDKVFVTVGVKS